MAMLAHHGVPCGISSDTPIVSSTPSTASESRSTPPPGPPYRVRRYGTPHAPRPASPLHSSARALHARYQAAPDSALPIIGYRPEIERRRPARPVAARLDAPRRAACGARRGPACQADATVAVHGTVAVALPAAARWSGSAGPCHVAVAGRDGR